MKSNIKPNEIAIIIPAFNEHKNIEKLIHRINYYIKNPKIVLVDDSPGFDTSDIIKRKKIKVRYYHRKLKKGRGSAVIFGIKKIINDICHVHIRCINLFLSCSFLVYVLDGAKQTNQKDYMRRIDKL